MELKELLKSEAGRELKLFLVSKCETLRYIEKVKEHSDPVAQSIELKAQQKAYKLVKSMLEEILLYDRKTVDKSKDDYNVM